MIIGVVGAGAVGGYCGAMLRRAGHDVIFAARGQHLDAMKKHGLLIHSDSGSFRADGHFTSELEDVSLADLVLFTVSSIDTRETAEQLLPLLKSDAVILTLQNGVENEEILTGFFGQERVLSGAAYLTVSLEAPGVICQEKLQTIVIGALAEAGRKRAEAVVQTLQEAGLDSEWSPCILEEKWSKLLINGVFNPISALNRVTVGEIIDQEPLRRTAERSLAEAVKIGTALGIAIKKEQLVENFFTAAEAARNHKTSMLQHREQGKSMEVEALCGYFVRKGRALRIDTPVFSELYEALTKINNDNERKHSTPP